MHESTNVIASVSKSSETHLIINSTHSAEEQPAVSDPDALLLRVASPIPAEVVLRRDEYFLSSEADYVAPLSVMISFLVKVIIDK